MAHMAAVSDWIANTVWGEILVGALSLIAASLFALAARKGKLNPAVPNWVPYAILAIVLAAAIAYLLYEALHRSAYRS